MKNDYPALLLVFLLSAILMVPHRLSSQEQPNEIKIKRSGDFYWGQAYNKDSLQAKQDARDDLMYKISGEINKSDNLTSNSDVIINRLQYLFKPVGDLYKAIAYVLITDVKNVSENKSSLNVIELQYTEDTTKMDDKVSNKSTAIRKQASSVEQENTIVTDIASEPIVTTTLLDRLIACNTAGELRTILQNEASNNSLVFNWGSKSYQNKVSSDPFFIALINPEDERIVAFLNKGKGERKDFKNPQRTIETSQEYLNCIQVWIHFP